MDFLSEHVSRLWKNVGSSSGAFNFFTKEKSTAAENATEDKTAEADPSEEKAATTIQASFRGFKARKESDEMKGQEISKGFQTAKNAASAQVEQAVSDANEELDIDLTDPDLSKAATKIQASFRGHKVRKEVKPPVEAAISEAAAAAKTEEEEVLDIDLTDPDLEKAATKIQATFRGYQTRAKDEKK